MAIILSAKTERLIKEQMESGKYSSEREVVETALLVLAKKKGWDDMVAVLLQEPDSVDQDGGSSTDE